MWCPQPTLLSLEQTLNTQKNDQTATSDCENEIIMEPTKQRSSDNTLTYEWWIVWAKFTISTNCLWKKWIVWKLFSITSSQNIWFTKFAVHFSGFFPKNVENTKIFEYS